MKAAVRSPRKRKVNLQSEMFSLSDAKTYLGRLVERASHGEAVYIVRGRRKFLIQEVPQIDPIPVRPPGYFSQAYTAEEISELNQLAKASVAAVPKDLE